MEHNILEFLILGLDRTRLERDPSALACKVNGIGQDIVQDLSDSFSVTDVNILFQRVKADFKGNSPGSGFRGRHGGRFLHQFLQGEFSGPQGRIGAAGPAHIHHMVDQGHQRLAGNADIIGVFQNFLRIIRVLAQQGHITGNGVHGNPEIMGQSCQEIALGLVGTFHHIQDLLHMLVHIVLRSPVFENDYIDIFAAEAGTGDPDRIPHAGAGSGILKLAGEFNGLVVFNVSDILLIQEKARGNTPPAEDCYILQYSFGTDPEYFLHIGRDIYAPVLFSGKYKKNIA